MLIWQKQKKAKKAASSLRHNYGWVDLQTNKGKNKVSKKVMQNGAFKFAWQDLGIALEKVKIFGKDHWHLLIKSAAENHLRIQQLKQTPVEGDACNLTFGSYSELKRYQKKVRLLTFSSTTMSALAVAFMVQIFLFGTSQGATYMWNQGKWDSSSSANTVAHDINEGGKSSYTSWESKSANLAVTSPAPSDSTLGLTTTTSSVSQTDDTTANTGFNLANKVFSSTQLYGSGNSAGVGLAATVTPTNLWDVPVRNVPGNVGNGSVTIRNGSDDEVYALGGGGSNAFYRYAVASRKWTTLTNVPGNVSNGGYMIRNGADNDIYVSAGFNGTGFWRYSISGNSWTTLTALSGNFGPGSAMVRNGADNDIYVLQGNGQGFWRYSIAGNSWTSLTAVPGAVSNGGRMLRNGSADDIYVLQGNGSTGFYKYSIAGNSWTTLAVAPGNVGGGSAMLRNGADNDIYVLQGNFLAGFYKYSISGNSWTTLTAVPANVAYGGMAVRNGADNDIYVLQGNTGTGFYRYSIAGNSWATLTTAPGAVDSGSFLLRNGTSNDIYVVQGNSSVGFWKYSVSGNTWVTNATSNLTNAPGLIAGGSSMIRNGADDEIYVTRGGGGTEFYKYSIAGNSWTTLAAVPGIISEGSNMIRNGADNDIYVTQGGTNIGFYRYSISGNSWTALNSVIGFRAGSSLIRNGSEDYIYAVRGNTNLFYRYSISGNAWTALAALPDSAWAGSKTIRSGASNDIYVTQGGGGTGFWRYSISGNSWTTLASVPGSGTNIAANMIRNGTDNDIYVTQGGNGTGFYRYSISGNSWAILATVPGNSWYGASLIRNGADNEIYALQGNYGTGFYRYSISGNAWTTLNAVPGAVDDGGGMIRNGSDNEIYVKLAGGAGFYKFIINEVVYAGSGTYTSGAVDMGRNVQSWNNVSWSRTLNSQAEPTVKARSSATTDFSSATAWGSCSNITNGTSLTTGSCVTNGHRYLQYQVSLSTGDTKKTPTFDDVTFNYAYYPTGQTLISSPFDSGSSTNAIGTVAWKEIASMPTGAGINFSVRTAATQGGLGSASWNDFTNSGSCTKDGMGVVSCPGTSIPAGLRDGVNDQWFQYKVTLNSAGDTTPTFDETRLNYIVNGPPEINITSATQGTDGKITINYQLRSPDGADDLFDSVPFNVNIAALEYCTLADQSCTTSGWASAVSYTGDTNNITAEAVNWTNGQIVWTPKTDFNARHYDNFKVRLKADDGEIANRYGYGTSTPFVLDTKDPTNVSVVVDHSTNNLILTTPSEDTSYTMAVAKTADFSAASDVAFASPYNYSSIGGDADPVNVFVRIKDEKGNYTIAQSTTPGMPANLSFYDLSNSTNGDYREFISWQAVPVNQVGAGFASYEIYRSDGNQSNFVKVKTEPIRLNNFFLDTGLTQGVHYYYKVYTLDTVGNISKFSNIVDDTPDGQGQTDQTAPTLSAVTVSAVSTTSAKVAWTTDEISDSSVAYSVDTDYIPERAVSSMGLAHEVTLTGLAPSTTYNIRVKSRDIVGNLGQNDKDNPGSSPMANYTFTTNPGPAISNVAIPNVSNNQATITWNTTLDADTYVAYSDTISNGSLLAPTTVGSNLLVGGSAPFAHSWTLNSLVSGETYYFYVKSTDGVGNMALDDNGGQFYSLTTTVDSTPPSITSYVANPLILTDTQTAVGYSTSEKATSRLGYKKAGDMTFTYTAWNDTPNSEHIFVVTGLEKETAYDYYIEVQDVDGNNANSPQSNLTTDQTQVAHPDLTNPNPANIKVLNATDTQAVISVETNTDATAKLCYAEGAISNGEFTTCLDGNVADSLHLADSGSTSVKHVFELGSGAIDSDNPALAPNTTYNYRIQVTDSQNGALQFLTAGKTFTTKKIQLDQHDALSSISTPTDADITVGEGASESFAVIAWTTDQVANSAVACSTTDSEPYNEFIASNAVDFSKSHMLKVTGLPLDTKIYCRVTSTDDLSPATTKQSSKFNFTTTKPVDQQHPPLSLIENIETPVITDTEAIVKFTTDQIASCKLEYGSATGNYSAVPLSEAADSFNKFHSLHLLGLIFQTQYFYKITCEDNLGTIVSSNEQTLTTKEKMLTGSEWGANSGGDIVPPAISNVRVAATTGESATITWDTDENASSNVRFGIVSVDENAAADSVVNKSRENYLKAHSVLINNLVPGTKYLFTVTSADSAGNIAESGQDSFVTDAVSSLSSIKVESKNLGEATIIWKSSADTNSTVEYGLTESYGEKKENSAYGTEHEINLSGLNQGVTYHYRVKGKDRNGRYFSSSDNTFEPKSPPKIENIDVNNVTEHGATVSFTTSVPTDANITYTDIQNKDNTSSQGKAEMATEHKVELKNLESGITYAIRISVRDEQGTQSDEQGKDFTTGRDQNPPKIDQVRTDSALTQSDKVQTIINWKTDEQATTALVYKESRGGEEKEVKITDNLTTGHVAVITTFKAGAVYYFKVKSIDASGNTALSNEFALLTPKRKENIIQVIINNFQDIFGWAKR